MKNTLNHPADVKRFSNEFKFAIVVAPKRLPSVAKRLIICGCAECEYANNLPD